MALAADPDAPNLSPLERALRSVGTHGREKTRAERVARRFLNPEIPFALQEDPTGEFHFENHISMPDCSPIRGIEEEQPIPLYLRHYQARVINHPAKKKVLRFGRRTGKTMSMSADIALQAVENENCQILILTPNESQIKVIFDDYLRPLFRVYRHRNTTEVGLETIAGDEPPQNHDLAIVKDTQKPQEIVLTNGTTIRGMVITDSARGQSADYVVIDEADYADTEKIQAIVGPIMMTSPNTQVIMSSTPTGRRDSFFYQACHNPKEWQEFHETYEVLPHYDEDLRASMIEMAGGEDTNTYQQEYMARFGTETEGVFDQKALNSNLYIAPYNVVMERVVRRTRERKPMVAAPYDEGNRFRDYRTGAQPFQWGHKGRLGAKTVWRPGLPGTLTCGTDWNDVAGMQTVIIWWPPEKLLKSGRIKVARFDYQEDEPITSERAKEGGRAKAFKVGHDNGDPGGKHDLTSVKGLVIWHGRLESGNFNWSTAANRVLSMMAIPDFIDAWYVDYGYGQQINNSVLASMESGLYQPDGNTFLKSKDELEIEEPLLRNIRKFHPEKDFERTGKLYKPIQFNKRYEFRDFGFTERGDNTKDVLVGLAKREVFQRRILFPYGELVRKADKNELGVYTENPYDVASNEFTGEEVVGRETDRDIIEPTGSEEAKGERSFGGLISQMRSFRVEGRSPHGKPRYAGPDHAIDALMLAILAYYENYADARPDNPGRVDTDMHFDQAEEIIQVSAAESAKEGKGLTPNRTEQNGSFSHPNYSDLTSPLQSLLSGGDPSSVGTSMKKMMRMARRHFGKKG